MKFGYARVSTQKQDLNDQIKQLTNLGIKQENIFAEKFSGININRPKLQKLLDTVKTGDEVIVVKLDRLSRSIRDGIEIIDELNKRGVLITVKGLGTFTADDTPMENLMRNMLLSFAEFERSMVIERMASGKIYAKMTNPKFKEGRPKKVLGRREMNVLEFRKEHSLTQTAEQYQVSVASIKRWQKILRERSN